MSNVYSIAKQICEGGCFYPGFVEDCVVLGDDGPEIYCLEQGDCFGGALNSWRFAWDTDGCKGGLAQRSNLCGHGLEDALLLCRADFSKWCGGIPLPE